MKVALVTLAIASLVLAGCGDATVVPDAQMSIGVANGTSIPVTLVVNGSPIKVIPPTTNIEVPAAQLPALPWQAHLTTAAGRTLVSLGINSGDVHRTSNGSDGVGHRVDLSCGRLDVYSGPPMLGPMPGPGVPGDCD